MKFSACFLVVSLLLTLVAGARAEGRYEGSFAHGVELFYQQEYGDAIAAFEKAEVANPGNHAAYLWHGLALVGNNNLNAAHDVWTMKMPWDTKAKALAYYFRGLGHWRLGETKDAKYWFDQTLNYQDTPGYKLCQKATLALLNEEEVPPFDTWPSLASLPGATAPATTGQKANQADEKAQSKSNPAAPSPAAPATQKTKPPKTPTKSVPTKPVAAKAGAKPKGGLWKATITNGYKGQKLSFRVSADGKTISDITFQGYLICRGSQIKDTQLAPLKNVTVKNGAFSDTQLNGGAKVRFDFTGTFSSATSATGTYRVMSDTDCDTYKLTWTASRAG